MKKAVKSQMRKKKKKEMEQKKGTKVDKMKESWEEWEEWRRRKEEEIRRKLGGGEDNGFRFVWCTSPVTIYL